MRLHDVSKASGDTDDKVLSEEELRKLQKVFISVLDELKEICVSNNLKFVLIGGTGIGVMRHHGFIPWDDDVDIAMARFDYEKLRKIIREKYSEKYVLSDPQDKKNFGKIIPKLRLRGTDYRTVLDSEEEDPGIRLDIFIVENTYDFSPLRYLHGVLCMFFGFALGCRRLYQYEENYERLSDSRQLKLKAFIGRLFSFASLEKWAYWTDRCHAACKNGNSRYVTVPSDGPHYFKGLTKRENLCEVREMPFEGRMMWVPAGVHDYLTGIYGDYMTIPPESKRVRSKYLSFDLGKYDIDE